jgi:hypothetical protein
MDDSTKETFLLIANALELTNEAVDGLRARVVAADPRSDQSTRIEIHRAQLAVAALRKSLA